MLEALRSARSVHPPLEGRRYHVSIFVAASAFGQLVVEYFARIVQDSLDWCAVDSDAEVVRNGVEKLWLPRHQAVNICEAKSVEDQLQTARNSRVVVYCGSDVEESLVLARCCADEGVHFVGKLEHSASVLLRMKMLHFAAKQSNCAIIPVCSRDTTLAELGLLGLKNTFMPGVLLEASLFRPIARTYKSLFWDTAKLALQRVDSSYASSMPLKPISADHTTLKTTTSAYTAPKIVFEFDPEVRSTPPLPESVASSASSASVTGDSEGLVSVVSLGSLTDDSLCLPTQTSPKLKSKAKSYGDLAHAEVRPNPNHTTGGNGAYYHSRRSSTGPSSRRQLIRQPLPPAPKPPLIPSFKQIIRSRSTASSLSEPTLSSLHPVVNATLKTVPVRLCLAPRSVTPLALSSTSFLPDCNEGAHKLEVHHVLTTSVGSRFFFILFRFLLVIFLVIPLVHVLLAKFAPSKLGVADPSNTEESRARLAFYVDRSPTTLSSTALRQIDPKFDHKKIDSLSEDFKQENARPLIVGGIGTTSAYLASSSHQSSSQLKFVEVSAPKNVGHAHANVMCVAMCAIALALFPNQNASSGVVPPLSAAGKRLKDWLVEEGFHARLVSYGRK